MTRRLSWLLEFWTDEDGGDETISLVLWLPFVMAFFTMVADFSFIMFNRSELVRVAEDSTRLRSIGVILSDYQTEQDIANRAQIDGPATIVSQVSQGVVRTQITVPISSIDAFGIFAGLSNDASVTIHVSQFKENPEA